MWPSRPLLGRSTSKIPSGTFPGDSSPGRSRVRRTYRVLPALFLLGCSVVAEGRGRLDGQAVGGTRRWHRGATPLMPPRWLGVSPLVWWALGGWPTGSPVGYGLTGSVAGGPKPRVQGRSTAAGPGGGADPWGASAAPPPLFPPVEPTPAASPESHEHNRLSAPAIRERVVLLPHAPIEPTDTRTQNRRILEMTTGINGDGFPRQYSIHPIVSNTPQTWGRGPHRLARPMLHLLSYPRRRRAHQPAVSRAEAQPRQGL